MLNGDPYVVCNASSSVQIGCNVNTNLGLFGEWVHTYSGTYIKTVIGKELNNTSVITIDKCDYADLGEYTCKAWNKIENQTYWSNFTTRLFVYGTVIMVIYQTHSIVNC